MSGPLRPNPPTAVGLASTPPQPESDGISVWLLALRMVRRRVWLMLGIVALISLAALPAIMSMEKRYFAETRILVTSSPALRLAVEETQPGLAPVLDTQVERLLSNQVIGQVIAELGIADLPEFNGKDDAPGLSERLRNLLAPLIDLISRPDGALASEAGPTGAGAGKPVVPAGDEVMRKFRSALSFNRQGSASAMSIGFASRDPALAQAVPTAVVGAYLAQANARWQAEIANVSDWMAANIARDRAQVADSRAARDRFLTQSGLGSGGDFQITQRLSMVEQRQNELDRERFQTGIDQRSVAVAQADPDLPARSEPEALERLRRELAQESRELAKAATTYGSASQQVKQRAERVDGVKEMITAELSGWALQLQQRADAQAVEASELEAEATRLQAQLAASRAAEPMAKALRETVMMQEEALAQQEYRHQKLLSQAGIAAVEVEVLMPSTLSPAPVGPGRKVYLLAVMAGAGLLALIVIALTELFDKSLRSHEQLAHVPRLVPVGLVPRLRSGQRRSMAANLARGGGGPVAEAVRDTILLLECANRDRFPQFLTVTTPEPRDRVEPIAEWLAIELAMQGHRVRLVDARSDAAAPARKPQADPASPPKHATALVPLALPAEPGPERLVLADLANQQGCDAATMLRNLGEQARDEDIITIVDGPALMSGAGLRLARDGGQILLVLRWGQTRRAVVELVAALLGRIGAKQIHTLIVGINPRRHRLYGFDDRLTLSSRRPVDAHA
jgi:uncharacterized protein involved in exopolysaccharide biosynthesis